MYTFALLPSGCEPRRNPRNRPVRRGTFFLSKRSVFEGAGSTSSPCLSMLRRSSPSFAGGSGLHRHAGAVLPKYISLCARSRWSLGWRSSAQSDRAYSDSSDHVPLQRTMKSSKTSRNPARNAHHESQNGCLHEKRPTVESAAVSPSACLSVGKLSARSQRSTVCEDGCQNGTPIGGQLHYSCDAIKPDSCSISTHVVHDVDQTQRSGLFPWFPIDHLSTSPQTFDRWPYTRFRRVLRMMLSILSCHCCTHLAPIHTDTCPSATRAKVCPMARLRSPDNHDSVFRVPPCHIFHVVLLRSCPDPSNPPFPIDRCKEIMQVCTATARRVTIARNC